MKNRLLLFLFLVLSTYAYGQNCTLSVSISQSAPTICSGYSVTLTAVASSGTAPYSYVWSTGETTPSISVDKAGAYTVTVTDKTAGCQPVKQIANVTSTTTPDAPTAASQTVCVNTSATLTATAPGGAYQWYDAASGGNFLASGATYVTPPITQGTVFYVETTVGGCTSSRTPVFVNLAAKPTVQPVAICSGNVATLIATGGSSFIWYDAPSGGSVLSTDSIYTTPVLTKNTTYYVSSVSNTGCESTRAPAFVTVTAQPQTPTAPGVTICSGSSANLHATGNGTIFNWYSAPSGGVPLISSPDYTTPALTANNTYYVADATNGCESARAPVTVTVLPLPGDPASQNDTTCYQSSITLHAGGGATTYQWFDAPNGNLLATGNTFTTPVLVNSTTYYLRASNGNCFSTFSPVNVVVRQQLPAPTAAGDITCLNSPATLTATSQGGGIYQWYNAASGGTLLATGPSFTTPPLAATTTYYVQNIQSGCVSARAAVKVTVLPSINPPAASGTSICAGDTAVLSASGSSGGYAWYDSAKAGNLLSSAQVFVTPVLNTSTTYYVEATDNGCASSRVAVKVTVNPTPVAPTINGVTVCPGMSATLTATGATGTVKWYDAATGGNLLATGNTFKSPKLNTTTTYYAESISGQCMSAMVPVTVTVNATSQFQYPGNTFCVSSPNPTPAIFNPSGGTFSAAPAGLVFVSNVTGQINISASKPGRYSVTFSGKGSCTVPESQVILITLTPDASFSYSGPFCQGGANPLPIFTPTSSGGTFTAAPAGLVFINSSTGQIDLANSTAGPYTITNTISASGGCAAATATTTVTIDQKVIVSAGPNQTVATGSPVQLAGSITGAATTGTWSGGTGSFSNKNSPTAVYTPGAAETKATLTLTSADPPGPCGPASAKVTITFTSQPAAPTVQSVTDCSGSSVTLSATAPGGTYQWYDAAAGGNLLNTGPDFTTPVLNATTTYYVQTTNNNGVTSARTPATVTINPVPAAPQAPGDQICTGTAATLSASGSAGTYDWYDAAAGGNLLSSASTYTTPVLTANTSYYVQTTVNGCISPRTQVNLLITPKPTITSAATGTICSGQPLSYNITADLANTTFIWSRAKVAGISNPAATNQTSSTITETLINTGNASVNVTYVITPSAGNCAGSSFNYVVTVYPVPAVTSPAIATICNSGTDNYAITFSGPVANFSWSRAAVQGISNQPVSGQAAGVIREVLFNTTNQPVNVTYVFNYSTATCSGAPFNLVITVNPQDSVTSASKGLACTGTPQGYVITSNVPSSTYIWSRPAVNNISNPAVANQTSGTITETLINTSISQVDVVYNITPVANGCPGVPFAYTATVNPKLNVPVATSNSPVCQGTSIHLSTAPVTNATYSWTGPNGYTSSVQNPVIDNASVTNSGQYTLVYLSKGCASLPVSVQVAVDAPPVANAGPDQVVCIKAPQTILDGTITGGTSTGIWTTAGTGTFVPSNNTLNAHYIPSAADTAAGSVKLTLTSTSKDNCAISSSSMMIIFGPLPAVNAGGNQSVCSQDASIPLAGSISIPGGGIWATAGSGTFSPAASQLVTNYLPSAADVQNGSVQLTLTANDAGVCYIPADTVKITFIPPPTVYAGGTRYVLKGNTITLYPTVSDNNVHYLWSPDIDINNDTLKNPEITGDIDRVYTLTVTDSRGCVAQDTTLIKVSPVIKVNNTFTPNGDGINDYWDITGLIAYQDATVDIFDRWGQKVFHSLGYPKPWDGTYNGKPVPVGVYYYVINTHLNGQVLSGYVTVIR